MAETEYQHVPRAKDEALALMTDLSTPLDGNVYRDINAILLKMIIDNMVASGYTDLDVVWSRGPFKSLKDRLDAGDSSVQNLSDDLRNISVNWINKNLGKLDGTFFTDQFITDLNNGVINTTTLLDNSVTDRKLANNSITNLKLADYYNYNGLKESGNLNNFSKAGSYLLVGVAGAFINTPEAAGSFHLYVQNAGGWVTQWINSINDARVMYTRTLRVHPQTGVISEVGNWQNLKHIPQKFPYLTESDDLNDLTEDGQWVSVSSINTPFAGNSAKITVKTYRTTETSSNIWGTQIASGIQTYNQRGYFKRDFIKSPAGVTFFDWEKYVPTDELHVVNLGDSIFGNTQGVDSVSNRISEKTGYTTYNIGFGGSRIAKHGIEWDAFSLYRLVDEIVKDNTDGTKWGRQNTSMAAYNAGTWVGVPDYYGAHLSRLKSIDFNKIDIVTIAGGTNDYTSGDVLLDNPNDTRDVTTFAGSLRHSLSKLMQEYPHLKIMVITPMYRFWWENGEIIEDSDTRKYAEQSLPDFVEVAKLVGKEFKIPVLDNYYELGINRFNREYYFDGTDGTHPNSEGNKKLGSRIGSALISSF